MKKYCGIFVLTTVAALSVPVLSGCQPSANSSSTPVTSSQTSSARTETAQTDNSCYVHLFDDDNFNDDSDIIYGPGKWENLRDLPGASQSDWSGDADSLKVGSAATVTIWAEENFQGTMETFAPGTEKPTLKNEPESMEITCQ